MRIYNPEDESLITKNLNNYYEGNIGIGVVSNTSFYAKINQGSIYKVDFSDLDAITETSHVGLSNNSWVNHHLLFQVKLCIILFITIAQVKELNLKKQVMQIQKS